MTKFCKDCKHVLIFRDLIGNQVQWALAECNRPPALPELGPDPVSGEPRRNVRWCVSERNGIPMFETMTGKLMWEAPKPGTCGPEATFFEAR